MKQKDIHFNQLEEVVDLLEALEASVEASKRAKRGGGGRLTTASDDFGQRQFGMRA